MAKARLNEEPTLLSPGNSIAIRQKEAPIASLAPIPHLTHRIGEPDQDRAMADQAENLVVELLRQLRAESTTLRNEVRSVREEMRDGFNRVEVRLGVLEQGMASLLALSASDRDELTALKRRVERIERRLDLCD